LSSADHPEPMSERTLAPFYSTRRVSGGNGWRASSLRCRRSLRVTNPPCRGESARPKTWAFSTLVVDGQHFNSSLSFRRLITDLNLSGPIRSVTHQVLAPGAALQTSWRHPRAHPAAAGPENIQCRVVFIQLLKPVAPAPKRTWSNPLLTHDAVESASKAFLSNSHLGKLAAEGRIPISPVRF
jgi:hypothetical protein